ncbi:MAG: hypothetical protein JWQ99_2949 [Blastococcus sp.]|jgi:hypothetical protein|nr:hypothetical protein [Blastococcus sp.]
MSGPVHVNLRLWRLAGAFALLHVVLTFVGVAFQNSPELGASARTREAALVDSSMVTVFAGGYVEYLGFLVFLAGALLLGRLLRGSGDTQRWLSSLIDASAVTYTAITFATGMAAGAAALYDGHRGVDLATVTAINDVRIFAFYLSVGVVGLFTVAVAGAVRATGALPRWIATTGFAVGALCIAAPAAQQWDAVNYVSLLFFVWSVALGIAALRGPRTVVPSIRDAAAVRA